MVDFAQQMNQTNFQAYVPQDRTGEIIAQGEARAAQAEAIGGQLFSKAVETGMEVWNAYEVNKFTNEMNDLNKEYMAGRTQSPMLTNNQTALDKMTAALEQGSMSPQEYNTRVRALTREAINRAPGFTKDFIRQANTVFEYSGMKSILELDTKMVENEQKAFENFSKDIKERAEKYGMAFDYSQANNSYYLQSMNKKLMDYASRQEEIMELDNFLSRGEKIDKKMVRDLTAVGPDGTSQLARTFTNVSLKTFASLDDIFKNVKGPEEFSLAKRQAANMIVQDENNYIALLAPVIDDPKVSKIVERLKESNKLRLDAIEKATSKEDMAKFVENGKKLFMDSSYLDKYEKQGVNPYVEDTAIKLLSSPNLRLIIGDGKFNELESFVMGITNKTMGAFENPKLGKAAIETAIGQLGSAKGMNDIVDGYPAAINASRKQLTPQQAYRAEETYITALAKGDPEKIKLMSEAGRVDAMNLITNNAKVTWQGMVRDIQNLSANGRNIQLDATPDGKIIIRGDISGQEAAKYTARINNSIQAMANVLGISSKDAAEKYLYPSFTSVGSTDPFSGVTPDVQAKRDDKRMQILLEEQRQAGGPGKNKDLDAEIAAFKKNYTPPTKEVSTPPSTTKPTQSTPLLTPAPVTDADRAYAEASKDAEKQREKFYKDVIDSANLAGDLRRTLFEAVVALPQELADKLLEGFGIDVKGSK